MNEASKPQNGPERPADEAVDRHLREALQPPPGAAERLARRALDGEARRARPPVVRPAVAAVGLALAAVALAALLFLPRLDRLDGPGGLDRLDWLDQLDRAEPVGPPTGSARYSITNRGEVIVVQALDGGASSLHANRATPEWRPSPPGRKLLVHGGPGP
jgi:hypothetical protein